MEAVILKDRIPEVLAAIRAQMQIAVEETAKAVVETAQHAIENPPKTGHIYKYGPEPLPHQASAPGEAPANWTGALRDSIKSEMVEETATHVIARVTAGEGLRYPYARYLEFGSPAGKIAARPYFYPAADENVGTLRAAMIAGIREVE